MNTSRTFYNIIALAKEDQSDIAAVAKRQEWMRNGNKWDDIIQGRELPHNTKYMVVDLETHDWLSDWLITGQSQSTRYDTARIVEIAWQLFDDLGKCLESRQYLIKPYGYAVIAKKATRLHGITSRQAYEHGVDVKLVLDELIRIVADIPNDGFIIAHNMDHEHTVLTNSFSTDQRVVWNDVPKSDTMLVSLLKYLPSSNHHNKRNLSLSSVPILVKHKLKQLHKFVYQDQAAIYDYDYEHFADKDVRMTWEIFQYYQQHATVNELKWEESAKSK